MELLDCFCNYVFNKESIYDILNAEVNPDMMKEVAESMLEFKDANSIILYTSLNENNTKLLEKRQYNKILKAFEYAEAALGLEQAEYVIKIEYNTQMLFDTLHPKAYKEIENIIKKYKLKKSEIEDMQIVKEILKTYTGVRVHTINPSKKCYTHTRMIFDNSNFAYMLNPKAIQIMKIKKKEEM